MNEYSLGATVKLRCSWAGLIEGRIVRIINTGLYDILTIQSSEGIYGIKSTDILTELPLFQRAGA